jgi:hypothetical protein
MLMRQSRFRRSPKPCRPSLSTPYVTCLVYDCLYEFSITDVLPARHASARSVPFPTAARANVPGLRASHGIWRTGPARAATEDSNRLPILSQKKGALDMNEQSIACDATRRDCATRSNSH